MSVTWISSHTGTNVPPNAIQAGSDSDGTIIHVGKVMHKGSHIPAKVLHSKSVAYYAFGGQEIAKKHYEILCGTGFSWVANSNGNIPSNALPCGKDGKETLYIGRVNHNGSLTPGKICTHHGCIYIPYDGSELRFTDYEVLVHFKKSEWVRLDARGVLPAGAILGGNDTDGSEIYIGRAVFKNEQMPAKVIPSKHAAYVAYGGEEHLVSQYEVLCDGNTCWDSYTGNIPTNAVLGGKTSSGEKLYIGRGHHEGSLTVGKIHPSHGSLYIPFGGSEVPLKQFEILVEH